MSHHLSLSKWALAKECSYWARPDVELPFDPPGPKARIGTLTHLASEFYADSGVELEDFPGADPAELAEALAIFRGPLKAWIDVWRARDVPKQTELRLRYDSRADRSFETPRRDEAGYTRPGASEVTGELDFVTNFGAYLEIEDLKTGKFSDSAGPQLDAYAVLAARFFGVSKVRRRAIYARKTKLVETPWVELDADALDAEAGAIARVLRRLPTVQATPPASERTCSFVCPLKRGVCPAWVQRDEQTLEAAGYFA